MEQEDNRNRLEQQQGQDQNGVKEVAYEAGTRQPNFLQKLYDFLAIEPHPCPDVIYWASDSRQLVIANPERLIKEVLPRLFKHDKMSSFGRQLNIYGFSRLFPGRQFKDSQGHVSDASVWAHPTLHRLSTPHEIISIKRRAAPKLFRTRRLADGKVVRTRAGPGVEAKFHAVRESIAETRRGRNSLTGGLSLGSITEGVASGNGDGNDWDRRGSGLSVESYVPETLEHGQGQGHMGGLNGFPLAPIDLQNRAIHSCPASIHTSPVLGRMTFNTPFWGSQHQTQTFGNGKTGGLRVDTHHANLGLKIAQPAAPNPFGSNHQGGSMYRFSPSTDDPFSPAAPFDSNSGYNTPISSSFPTSGSHDSFLSPSYDYVSPSSWSYPHQAIPQPQHTHPNHPSHQYHQYHRQYQDQTNHEDIPSPGQMISNSWTSSTQMPPTPTIDPRWITPGATPYVSRPSSPISTDIGHLATQSYPPRGHLLPERSAPVPLFGSTVEMAPPNFPVGGKWWKTSA